ncbi:hypothetical protein Tco_0087538 [Tanacetum coccineum]
MRIRRVLEMVVLNPFVEPIKVTTSNSFSALEEDDSRTWDEDNGGTNDNTFHVLNDSDNEDVDEYITMEEGTKSVSQESSNDQGASTPLKARALLLVGTMMMWIRPLWNGLCLHKHYINNRLWCLLGDFNASLYVDDTSIGRSTLDITMREFKECVETMEVMDVQRTAHAIFKPYRISDHSPSVLSIPSLVKVKPKPFKFFNVSILDKRFKDVVREGWSSHVSGFDMFRVVKKLKGLKKPIQKLMYDKGNLHKPKGKDGILRKIDRVLANLEFQDCFVGAHAIFKPYRISDHSPSVISIPSLVKVKPKPFKFFNVSILDKRFKDVVREGWSSHVSGFDMFRVVKKLKGLKKPIQKLMYDKGNLHANVIRLRENLDKLQTNLDNDPGNVSICEEEAAAVVAFNEVVLIEEKFLKQKAKITWLKEGAPIQRATTEFDTNNLFSTRLDANEALDMVRVVSSQEVKSAMFSMGRLLVIKYQERMVFYRPISCCNVLFKCISKIIANRLKDSLKRLISPNQSAFVPGRSISDNILLTQEIMHNYHLDRGVPRCAFKVDIQKAYDTVDWEFLRVALIGFGFHDRMISWIMECVSTTSFSISINGSLHGFLKGNGSLSVAGRLQLIQSVLGSLNVFWASVFVLPSRVLLDIEQIMRGFLWCQGSMSRGKAKVAWEVVCLPKKEGGLGIRRLDHFNKALMVSHIWKLLSLKESLWVKWIHVYKLRNRSFWEIPYRGKMAGFSLASKVRECIHGGLWSWPNDWLVKYPILNSIPVPVLNDAKSDVLEWRKSDGSYTPFSVQRVWDTIRPRDIEVPWYDLVWFSSCIPRHAVNMWLIMKKRLKTQDTLSSWDVAAGLMNVCPLCLMGSGSSLDSIVSILMPITKQKSFKSCIGNLTLAAAAYFVWQERNFWLFKHSKRSVQEVVDCIMSSVRLKLLSCRFKKSKDAVLFLRLWELPVSMLK